MSRRALVEIHGISANIELFTASGRYADAATTVTFTTTDELFQTVGTLQEEALHKVSITPLTLGGFETTFAQLSPGSWDRLEVEVIYDIQITPAPIDADPRVFIRFAPLFMECLADASCGLVEPWERGPIMGIKVKKDEAEPSATTTLQVPSEQGPDDGLPGLGLVRLGFEGIGIPFKLIASVGAFMFITFIMAVILMKTRSVFFMWFVGGMCILFVSLISDGHLMPIAFLVPYVLIAIVHLVLRKPQVT